jgi:hypothetical protein
MTFISVCRSNFSFGITQAILLGNLLLFPVFFTAISLQRAIILWLPKIHNNSGSAGKMVGSRGTLYIPFDASSVVAFLPLSTPLKFMLEFSLFLFLFLQLFAKLLGIAKITESLVPYGNP